MFTSLLPFLLLSAQALAQIPEAFTKGFDPETIELVVRYPESGKIQDGETLSVNETSILPEFALGDSSAISTSTNYIVVMLDPDTTPDPSTQVLHYLRTDFSVEEFTKLSSASTTIPVPYLGPVGEDVKTHRYVFLLYVQPDGYEGKLVPSADGDRSFNVSAWRIENQMKPAVAGVHFVCQPDGGEGDVGGDYGYGDGEDDSDDEGEGAETTTCSEGASMTSSAALTSMPAPTTTSTPGDEGEEGILTDTVAPPEATSSAAATATGTSPSAPATTHTVLVGGPGDLLLTYQPPFVNALPGDLITFDFREKNHTVTQSTFDTPCVSNPSGVKSGFRPNAEGTAGKEVFEYQVVDTTPKWFYCAQGTHCKAGMVFAINPGAKWEAFVENAKAGGTAPSASASATASATATASASVSVTSSAGAIATSTSTSTATATASATQSGGAAVPSANSTAPGDGSPPAFEGAASAGAVASWVLLGLAGVAALATL
ncbi:PEBP-like protein [Morchella conica CCBAS932]|uniref:PEBP-like protein n=1 Tax=Morchella conica CCBAS932 TaxID=1392247 RepID=A0A3N4KUB3_9PEZI|nr:PEBP-like protein [Morchella conica CCBAS932]